MISDGAAVKSEQQAKAKIFISYSRKDLAFADRLAAALKARGFEPLIDRSEIYAFEEWWQRIEALIIRSDTVVFVLTPDSVSSDVALKEVSFAASVNKRFAPVIRRRVDDKSVPKALAKLNFLFLMMICDSRRVQIGLPWLLTPTSPGSGSTRSSASRRGAGRWRSGLVDCCCARPCWSNRNSG